MILISGATGTVGSALAAKLTEDKVPIRILARNPAKVQQIAGPNVEIVEGDFDNPESLKAAFNGIERAFMLPPFVQNALELQQNFIDAAKAAGVKHVVKLSAAGASPDSSVALCRWHGGAEKALEASGLAWTHLRPNGFMQNFFQNAPAIQSQGQLYQPAADAKISFVDVRDIADVAAKVLTEDGHEGKIYEITGPEAVSFGDVAAEIAAATGKPVTYVPISDEAFRQAMSGYGAPGWMIDTLLELYAFYIADKGSYVTDDVQRIAGHPPRTVAQFAAEYANQFKA